MNLPYSIQVLIENISAPQAYAIIAAMGNPNVNIFSQGLTHPLQEVVAEESVRWQKATSVGPLTFWGGPPGMLRYYQGTLYTLLCDRLLDLIQAHGVPAAREICCVTQPKEKVTVWL